jgi:N-acetylated-alpha-linked acidic dipeptidase
MVRTLVLLLPLLVGAASALPAQTPTGGRAVQDLAAAVRAAITPEALREQARAIVRHERPSGSPGENAAIDHVVATLRGDGVPVEIHTFPAYVSDPVAARVEVLGTDLQPEAITLAFSGAVQGLEAPLVDVGSLRDLPELEVGTGERLILAGEGVDGLPRSPALPDVSGAIALVEGQPRNGPVAVLARLGAAGVIFVNPEERLNDLIVTSTWGIPSLRNFHRLPTLPVAQVKKSSGEAIRARLAHRPVRVRLTTEVSTGWKPLRLAVARIPAPDPDAPFVLLGGHIDAWYHGATDEGASNAAMVELARAFHRNRDKLRRGLVIAWWPGHSNGRYAGSTWFADQFFEELRARGVAYLNIDGIGQMGAKQFGANATSSLAGLASSVVRQRTGEEIRPTRPGRNSDQSFNGIGLPLLQLNHTRLAEDGGYWWWHTPDDTFDKIDFQILEIDTEMYADALAVLLAAPVLPVDAVAEVRALGELIDARQQTAGERFDLREARRRQTELLGSLEAIQRTTPAAHEEIDLALVRLLRPLHRVLYTPIEPFHPDPGVDLGLLPGLAPVEILARESPGTDRYRFAETTLIRERNRLLEALDQSIREAEGLRSRLGSR